MKGIVLAGGKGTRLHPITLATCKQLLPVYDKPLIYYPLSTLLYAGIREILIISTPEDRTRFEHLFGDGSHLGISLSYAVQPVADGIASAFLIGEEFINGDSCALVLGDNIFYGYNLPQILSDCQHLQNGAIIFGYEVNDPERYGVFSFDEQGRVCDIIEKPKIAPSPYAVTGLYFYDADIVSIVETLKPSARGELEITDVNTAYLKRKNLHVRLFERGFAWLDTGTPDALQKASSYVQTIQERQGIKIACIEEIAYQMGYISADDLLSLARNMGNSEYSTYLHRILNKTNGTGALVSG